MLTNFLIRSVGRHASVFGCATPEETESNNLNIHDPLIWAAAGLACVGSDAPGRDRVGLLLPPCPLTYRCVCSLSAPTFSPPSICFGPLASSCRSGEPTCLRAGARDRSVSPGGPESETFVFLFHGLFAFFPGGKNCSLEVSLFLANLEHWVFSRVHAC